MLTINNTKPTPHVRPIKESDFNTGALILARDGCGKGDLCIVSRKAHSDSEHVVTFIDGGCAGTTFSCISLLSLSREDTTLDITLNGES